VSAIFCDKNYLFVIGYVIFSHSATRCIISFVYSICRSVACSQNWLGNELYYFQRVKGDAN